MLVLSRRVNERIIINGGEIVITVVDIRGGDKVRLGIEADKSISVHREEVQAAVDAEARGGGKSPPVAPRRPKTP